MSSAGTETAMSQLSPTFCRSAMMIPIVSSVYSANESLPQNSVTVQPRLCPGDTRRGRERREGRLMPQTREIVFNTVLISSGIHRCDVGTTMYCENVPSTFAEKSKLAR